MACFRASLPFIAPAGSEDFKCKIGNNRSEDPEPRLRQYLKAKVVHGEARSEVHFEKDYRHEPTPWPRLSWLPLSLTLWLPKALRILFHAAHRRNLMGQSKALL